MTEAILQLKKLVDESDNIVFFGGAGVSTESGIKDFRSVDGLYHQKFKYPPETMLSHSFYESHMEEFYDFYRTKMLALDAQPNAAHKKLAQWEREGKLKAVISNDRNKNITSINGVELPHDEAIVLSNGDRIVMGKTTVVYQER